MSLTAFLIGNALLVLVLLTWNLYTRVSLRGVEPEGKTRWMAAVGLQWRFGAATAALIAVTVALFDAILGDAAPFGPQTRIVFALVAAGIGLVLGLLIGSQYPQSSEWAVGMLIGVSILANGLSGLMFSLAARRYAESLDEPGHSASL